MTLHIFGITGTPMETPISERKDHRSLLVVSIPSVILGSHCWSTFQVKWGKRIKIEQGAPSLVSWYITPINCKNHPIHPIVIGWYWSSKVQQLGKRTGASPWGSKKPPISSIRWAASQTWDWLDILILFPQYEIPIWNASEMCWISCLCSGHVWCFCFFFWGWWDEIESLVILTGSHQPPKNVTPWRACPHSIKPYIATVQTKRASWHTVKFDLSHQHILAVVR